MGYFFLLQMDDSFTEGLCFDTSKEGKEERRFGTPHCEKGKAKGPKPSRLRKLRPHQRSRCAEHRGMLQELWPERARPTGGGHGRITRGSRTTQDAKPRSVFYGAVSRSMRSTSSRGMWIAPANFSALSTPRSTISCTFPGVRSRYSAASTTVTFLRLLSSTLITSPPGKDGGRGFEFSGPSSCPYSPECVEWEFREVQMQDRA